MKETDTTAKPSLKLQAYHYLKGKILSCEYAPSQFLNEQKLCAEMGNISRTPMRDALGRLEQEGLIAILPKKGLMVSPITDEDVHSIYEVRLLVEPYALRVYGSLLPREELEKFVYLMQNPGEIPDFYAADDAFHDLLISALPNKYLRSAHDSITGQNTRFRIMTGKVGMISRSATCEEHLAILQPALAGDWEGAAAALTPEQAGQLVADLGIAPSAAIAQKAIPQCNLVFLSGEDMKPAISGYYEVLYSIDPTAVGGKLPDDDIYYVP